MNWLRPMASFKCMFLGHRWGSTFCKLPTIDVVFIQCQRCGEMRKL